MNLIKQFKKTRDNYVINQVEKAVIPDFKKSETVRYHIIFKGRVQHIGFRLETEEFSKRLGFTGWIRNTDDNNVETEIQTEKDKLDFFIDFMNNLKRIKIKELDKKSIPLKENETEFIVIK